jgi:caspase Dronc
MNNNHRKLIEYNIDDLIHLTDYSTMVRACLDRGVINEDMRKIIDIGADDLEKNRKLFNKLTHRGPTAFENLLDILKEKQYNDAYVKLSVSTIPAATFSNESTVLTRDNMTLSISNTRQHNRQNSYNPPSPNNNINNNNEDESSSTSNDGPVFSQPGRLKLEPYTVATRFHFDGDAEVKRAADFGSHPKLQVYRMRSKRRGVFVFVNIIKFKSEKNNRSGAEKDRENLVTLFREMGFTIFYYEDLEREDFFKLMNKLRKSEYLKNVDSFVLCIQTHGDTVNNQTVMEFADGHSTFVEDVIQLFSHSGCPDLVGKPKVFFFPFCRGKISDLEKKIVLPRKTETDGAGNPSTAVPSYSDILICYGTVPGFMTHRDTGENIFWLFGNQKNF